MMKTENTRKTRVMKTGTVTEKQEGGDEAEVRVGVEPVDVGEMGGEKVEGEAPPKSKRLSRRVNRMTIRPTMTKVRMRQRIRRENGNQE